MTAKREFYTTNEIAQILGLSPFTVRRYIQTRKLRAVKLEGSYRVRRSHLDDFIEAREMETEEELEAAEQAEEETAKETAKPQPPAAHSAKAEKKNPTRVSTRQPKRKSSARSSTRRKEEE
ncbi:MAG: helix-turn-helix domain-containing protein [Chloroflexi bacterium]|nr:helix-turn-helix domain-containing protein [Chloroflexota bacterium]